MKKTIKLFIVLLFIFVLFSCKKNNTYVDDEEHIYGEWIDEVEVTCTTDGVLGHYHCTHCNKDFDQFHNEIADVVVKSSGHSLVHSKEVKATGYKTGMDEYWECSTCKKVYSDANATVEVEKENLVQPIKTLTISEIKTTGVYGAVCTLRAVVIGATSNADGGYTYYILKDEDSNEQILLRSQRDSDTLEGTEISCIKGYSYAPNMVFPLGSIIEVPVKFTINTGKNGEAAKQFLIWAGDDYEDAIGYGTMLEWKAKYIVGTCDDYSIDKTQVTTKITNESELKSLLSNKNGGFQNQTIEITGTAENPIKFVTQSISDGVGDINREYLYFYYGEASSLSDISINGGHAVFSNFGNTFNMYSPLSCLLCNQTEYEDIDFSKPYEFVGTIYATIVGGNSSYFHFVVLSEDDIINVGQTGSHAVISSKMAKDAYFKYMEEYAASIGIDIHGDITTAVGTTNVITTSDLCRIAIEGINCEMLQDIWCDEDYTTTIKDKDGNPESVYVYNKVLNNEDCINYIKPYYTVIGTKGGSLNYTNKYRDYIHNVLMVVEGPNDTYLVGVVCNEDLNASMYTYPNLKRLFDILAAKVRGEDTTELEAEMNCDYAAGVAIPKTGCAEAGYDWFGDDSIYPHYTKDAETLITTASCWKTMTAVTCLSYITEEQLDYEVYVGSTELNSIASQPTFYGGERCTLNDALHFMMLMSSNVAPNVIARGVGELIIKAKLQELGLN